MVVQVRKKPGPRSNLTDVRGSITGNLTCMRNQPEPAGESVKNPESPLPLC